MKDNNLKQKRTMRTLFLFLLIAFVGLIKSYAYDFSAVCETGQTLYYSITDSENHYVAMVAPNGGWDGYTKPTGDIVLPRCVYDAYDNQYCVTSIGNLTFFGCNGLTGTLTIPNTVTTIDEAAFYGCSGFDGNLTISNSVISIGGAAFAGCSGLTGSLTIPSSVTFIGSHAFSGCSGFTGTLTLPGFITSIEQGVFNRCSNLTGSLTIPNSVTTIGESAFYRCSGFTGTLTLPNSINTISESAFSGCSGFTGTLTLPNSINTIGERAFSGCSGFTGTLILPNSITSIEGYAFSGCSGLTGALTLPNSITFVGDYAFYSCSNITSIIIGNSVISIGNSAFSGCTSLTGTLSIPNSLTSIGNYAFSGCTSLTGTLSIPNSLTSIGNYAFGKAFEHIAVDPSNMVYDSRDNCNAIIETNTNTIILGCKNSIIPNTVVSIGSRAFSGCSGLSFINIPNSVTSIGEAAFGGCSGLGTIIVPESVTTIERLAFNNCTGLTSVSIGNSVTTLGEWAFSDCSELTSLFIPNSVTSIGKGSFSGCSSLVSITIGNSITSIDAWAFQDCNALTSITMLATTPPSWTFPAFDYGTNNTIETIFVPYESTETYKSAFHWSDYQSRIYPWIQKNISGYDTSAGGWHFIASPVLSSIEPIKVDSMISEGEYDLYRFNQSADAEWENYKNPAHTEGFTINNGKGYLYASEENVNLMFKGVFNEFDERTVSLIYDAGKPLAGWNLVGNPFPINAYANRSYYVMNEAGTAIEPVAVSMETAIPACTGVMVKAETTGESVTFSKTAPELLSQNNGVLQISVAEAGTQALRPFDYAQGPQTQGPQVQGRSALDKAIVSFNAGDQLKKFVFNEDNAQLYIPSGKNNYAIACAEKTGEMPLNFKAKKNGKYTITVNPEKAEMEYLHLIDNLTGNDVDLLALRQAQGPVSYTFEAKTNDYASRFRLVFSICGDANGDNETFAYFNGSEWVVSNTGRATLQVVDVLGHILSSETINGEATLNVKAAPGVYTMRLVCGDDVRTQKIVVK